MREDRRVITAVFFDVVGSTALTERLDPEDVREILGGAIAVIIEQIEGYGGTIKDLAGDGVLALFGAPQSREDDELRAVQAALSVLDAVDGYRRQLENSGGPSVAVRGGIATGLAVVGPVGASSRVEYGAVGDVVNIAARLQAHAEEQSVLVAATTYDAIRTHFTWGPAQALELKGKSAAVAAFEVRGQLPDREIGDEAVAKPMVGRRHALECVTAALARIAESRGGALVLTGEPGIGKSRLVAEAHRLASTTYGEQIRWVEARCSELGGSTPLLPYRTAVRQLLDLPAVGADHASLVRRSAELLGPEGAAHVPFLAELLEIERDAEPDVRIKPENLQEAIFSAVLACVTVAARQRALVLAVEDLHWADETSLQLTQQLLDRVDDVAVLVVVSLRPGTDMPVSDLLDAASEPAQRHMTVVSLDRLDREEAQSFLRSDLEDTVLPEDLEGRVLDVAEGNPLFLRELARSLVESQSTTGAATATGIEKFVVPTTLEHVVLSRVDRLDEEAYDVAVVAAVIGRRFEVAVLERATPRSADPSSALRRLSERKLIHPTQPQAFEFDHVLIQQTIYDSLLRRRRQQVHAAVAEALLVLGDPKTGAVAQEVGRHFLSADKPAEAVPHLLLAARRAAATFANSEALRLFGTTLDAARPLYDRDRTLWASTLLEVLEGYGGVCHQLGQYEQAVAAYNEALALEDASPLARARLRTSMAETLQLENSYQEVREALDAAEVDLEAGEDLPGWWRERIRLLMVRVNAAYMQDDRGELGQLVPLLREGIEQHGTLKERADFHWLAAGAANRGNGYRPSPQAVDDARAGWAANHRLGDPTASAWADFHLGFALVLAGELSEGSDLLTEAARFGESAGNRLLVARCSSYLVMAARLRGSVEEVERLLPASEAAAAATLAVEYVAANRANAAWVEWRRGSADEAMALATEALDLWLRHRAAYPFKWQALWPLAACRAASGNLAFAVRALRGLVTDGQQRLPEDLARLLGEVLDAWDADRSAEVATGIRRLLDAAQAAHYL
ncbi:MAG: hypothetical protein QOK15_883 [Nocardioidaceae bacterium]|nr:hypothetical protein [Nocardioidaceae bacterium]